MIRDYKQKIQEAFGIANKDEVWLVSYGEMKAAEGMVSIGQRPKSQTNIGNYLVPKYL